MRVWRTDATEYRNKNIYDNIFLEKVVNAALGASSREGNRVGLKGYPLKLEHLVYYTIHT